MREEAPMGARDRQSEATALLHHLLASIGLGGALSAGSFSFHSLLICRLQLDGYLARACGHEDSVLGSYLDPLADKVRAVIVVSTSLRPATHGLVLFQRQ